MVAENSGFRILTVFEGVRGSWDNCIRGCLGVSVGLWVLGSWSLSLGCCEGTLARVL